VKREYHQRVAVLKEQAQQAAQEAVAGQVPEDERRRIRCGDNRMVVIDDIVCRLSTVDRDCLLLFSFSSGRWLIFADARAPAPTNQTNRAEAQAAAQGEAERAVAEARETVEKEARHGALVELRAQVQRERAKYEGEIVEMYRRRLKEVCVCVF